VVSVLGRCGVGKVPVWCRVLRLNPPWRMGDALRLLYDAATRCQAERYRD